MYCLDLNQILQILQSSSKWGQAEQHEEISRNISWKPNKSSPSCGPCSGGELRFYRDEADESR